VPAAALGQPRVLGIGNESDVSTAGYMNGRPVAASRIRDNGAPMLAPVPGNGGPYLTDVPAPAPLPGGVPAPAPAPGAGAVPGSSFCEACGPVFGGEHAGFGDPAFGGHGPWWTRTWFSAEFLNWFTQNAVSPPLVHAAPIPAVVGNERVLFSGASLYPTYHPGGRFTAGLWLDPCMIHGVDSSFMFLGTRSFSQTFIAPAGQILVRRVIDAQNGNVPIFAETANTMTVSGIAQLMGADINYRRVLCNDCAFRLDLLVGFRWNQLHDTLRFTETGTGPLLNLGNFTGTGIDDFAATNNFFGGQVGVRGERDIGRFFINGYGKIALGQTQHRIAISGGQQFVAPVPPPAGLPGNLLALNSNIGIHNATSFSVIPELGLNLGYHLTPRLRFFVGYTFMYWSNVMRAGEQIDMRIQPNRIPYVNLPPIPPPAAQEIHPVVQFKRTDFWAQGINVGLQFKW
jgi:hypothetical protein